MGIIMYKITLCDANCSAICEGIVCFFTEDLDRFENHLASVPLPDEGLLERFRRSRAGEIITDFYSDDPDLNIVQEAETRVLYDKLVTLEDVTFQSTNAYEYTQSYHVSHWDCRFLWIDFGGKGYRVVEYTAQGVCMYDGFFHRLTAVTCHGNPVLENTVIYRPLYSYRTPQHEWLRPDYKDFAENRIKTICFLPSKSFSSLDEIESDYLSFEITEEIMDALFADVIGEAG